jgi:membrane protein
VRQQVLDGIGAQFSPDLEVEVKSALDATGAKAPTFGSVGFVVLAITALAIFTQVDYAFDRIWHLGAQRQESWSQWIVRHIVVRFKALAMLLGVGAILLTVMIASFVWSGMQQAMADAHVEPWLSWTGGIAINIALNYFALTIVYKYVPKPRIYWREAFAAGLVTAPLWEVGRQLLALYLLRLNYPTAYGIIGSFMAIMLWAYYAMLVVLFGAEYVRVRQRERVESRELTFKA